MTRDVDPRQAATTLVERYGHEAAAAYVVKRIADLTNEADDAGVSTDA